MLPVSMRVAFVAMLIGGVIAWTETANTADPPSNGRRADTRAAQQGEPAEKEHPLVPALRLAKQGHKAVSELQDYEATFSKIERIGRRAQEQVMHLKVREEPFSVYLKYQNPSAGREVIFVEGSNGGKLLAHETGLKALVGTVSLLPTENRALDGNRYPITSIGMRNLLAKVIEQWEKESQFGECQVKYYPNAKLGDRECKVVEASHPVPRKEFKYHVTRLFLDTETNLPVRVEQYDFPPKAGADPVLAEQYTYSNIRMNTNLADVDFDIRNPKYEFVE